MFVIRLDTSQFESRNRKTWEAQLRNDICVKLNGLSWDYKTITGLKDRLHALAGWHTNSLDIYADSNYMTLKADSYGTQRVRKGLPGLCTGYVSWEKIEKSLNMNGSAKIPFTSFYDSRAISKSMGLDKCFVIIENVAK